MTAEKLLTLGLRCRPDSPFLQYLAIKPHEQAKAQGEAGGSGAALFVSGLPFGADEEAVSELFQCFGTVLQTVLHPLKRSGIVVFASPAGRAAALKHAARGQVLQAEGWGRRAEQGEEEEEDGEERPTGLRAWVAEHKSARPGHEVLQKQIDDWMDAYDEEQERAAREKQAAMGGDGWTVVVRAKGRKRTREEGGVSVQSGGVAAGAAAAAAAAAAADPSKSGRGDFYRFQRREARRSQLVELRERFEEDKRRVAQLKASRNFRPY